MHIAYTFFFYKNVVFLTQAEYSYFSYVCSIVMDYITQKATTILTTRYLNCL